MFLFVKEHSGLYPNCSFVPAAFFIPLESPVIKYL